VVGMRVACGCDEIWVWLGRRVGCGLGCCYGWVWLGQGVAEVIGGRGDTGRNDWVLLGVVNGVVNCRRVWGYFCE
jgi:hypothetical protein